MPGVTSQGCKFFHDASGGGGGVQLNKVNFFGFPL